MCTTCIGGFEAAVAASGIVGTGLAVAARRAKVLVTSGPEGLRAWRAERHAVTDAQTHAYLTALGLDADAVLAVHARPPAQAQPAPEPAEGSGSVRRMIPSTSR
jgi:hypothetical protein